jgi:hypothetical protein
LISLTVEEDVRADIDVDPAADAEAAGKKVVAAPTRSRGTTVVANRRRE